MNPKLFNYLKPNNEKQINFNLQNNRISRKGTDGHTI